MACFMPPPISAGVILTQTIGGNEKLAIICSVIGNFIGIIVCPITLHTFLLNSVQVNCRNAFMTFLNISWMVILPLFIGQFICYWIYNKFYYKYLKNVLISLNKIFLLFIIFLTFFDLFQNKEQITFGFFSIIILIFFIILVQFIMIILVYQFGLVFLINQAKTIDMYAITYSASLKSLSTGVVIVNALFSNNKDTFYYTQVILPLLLFEPIQILVGSLVIDLLKKMYAPFKVNDEEILLPS